MLLKLRRNKFSRKSILINDKKSFRSVVFRNFDKGEIALRSGGIFFRKRVSNVFRSVFLRHHAYSVKAFFLVDTHPVAVFHGFYERLIGGVFFQKPTESRSYGPVIRLYSQSFGESAHDCLLLVFAQNSAFSRICDYGRIFAVVRDHETFGRVVFADSWYGKHRCSGSGFAGGIFASGSQHYVVRKGFRCVKRKRDLSQPVSRAERKHSRNAV